MVPEPLKQPSPESFPEIPGYRIEALLGRGATGVVYRAVQLAVDRAVAIKVLHPELAGGQAVRRLQREARTTAKLAHPGIVTAIDMGESHGLWWYAMELVNGPSLAVLLRSRGRLPERAALRLFIPLCEALQHAYEHGVVHRDIKPANILIDESGRARLVDLGLAFAEEDPLLTKAGGTLGTPHYVSPEQARNPQSADVRSDIWSLGATFYHAVCGRPPFQGDSVAEILSGVLYARIADPLELAPEISRNLALVLRQCLIRNPERRYQEPSELLADLERIRERRPVHVERRKLDPTIGERERRLRMLWIGSGIAAVALVSALFVWKPWRRGEMPSQPQDVPQVFEPLLKIESQSRRGRQFLAKSLTDLEALRPVPPEFVNEYHRVYAQVESEFEQAVSEFQGKLEQEFEHRLNDERDFVRAAELVGQRAVEFRLQKELVLSDVQMRDALTRLELDRKREQVARDEDRALEQLFRKLNEYSTNVLELKVANDERAGAWKSAHESLQQADTDPLGAAQLSAKGLTPALVDGKVKDLRIARLDPLLQELEQAWRDLDGSLQEWVDARAAEVRKSLESRDRLEGASEALVNDFQAHLAQVGLRESEWLPGVADVARTALAARAAELARLEEELREQDAEVFLEDQEQRLEGAWKERRYTAIAAAWSGQLDEAWLERVRERMAIELDEARLLEDLLARAAKAVQPGQATILVGNIERPGFIELDGDVLERGFLFRTGSTSAAERWTLRGLEGSPLAKAVMVGTGGVERLAGIPPRPADISDPLVRLERALFRYREGEREEAARTFASGPLPRERYGPLISDLQRRLETSREQFDKLHQEKLAEAMGRYRLIKRDSGHARDTAERLRRIQELLQDYSDLEWVRAKEPELRKLQDQLRAPNKPSVESAVREAFNPSSVRFLDGGRVHLRFDFSSGSPGKWFAGDWQQGPEGWRAKGEHDYAQLRNEHLWPRLLLAKPLDLDAPLSAEFDLLQPSESGRPRKFVASVAGFHVAFAGPTEQGGTARLLVRAGGTVGFETLLGEWDDPNRGIAVQGLQRGKVHTLRIELTLGRGKIRVLLDGVQLAEQDNPSPENKPGSASIVVRSLEPVLLKSVRLEAASK
jgi:serine/threonine protein kinase